MNNINIQVPVPGSRYISPACTKSRKCEWAILSVEDDPAYQTSLEFAIAGMTFEDRPVRLLTASSGVQAALMLAEQPDIAVILLDVVMEEDDAGLRLVDTIRERIGNNRVRIVLLTGQPGMAPREDIMRRYMIDDYWNKVDLSAEQLQTVITGNLRTWKYIDELERARRGLQLLVDAGRELTGKRDLANFTQTLLGQIDQLIDTGEGGIVSAVSSQETPLEQLRILATSGCFKNLESIRGDTLPSTLREDIDLARQRKQSIFRDRHTILWFEGGADRNEEFLTLIRSRESISDYHIKLLQVFAQHANNGFSNIALTNRLSELAYYDDLLHIHNRNWLLWEITRLTRKERARMQLLLIGPDRFSEVNITLGDTFSDQIITSLYHRLCDKLHDYLSIARIDLDTFAILTLHKNAPDRATLQSLLDMPLHIGDAEHDLSVTTASLALADLQEIPPPQILRIAEYCIDNARREGKRFFDYTPGFGEAIRQRYHLMNDLRRALGQEELSVHLQPKVRLDNGEVVGFEALVRWYRADGSSISPADFIPLAEAAGLIGQLDEYVLRRCCGIVKQLEAAGIALPVAFNASSMELLEPDYFERLLDILTRYGVTSSQLELEVTESQAMENYDTICPQLLRLIEQGMGVSIDDFGTGYSSLSHITRLAATTLKIDRSFIQDLEHSREAEQVVEIVLRISARFGFKTIAEGVETQAQRQILLDKGCPYGQGYLFARPMPVEEIIALLSSGSAIGPDRERALP